MRYHVTVGEHTLAVELERAPDGAYRVRLEEGQELRVTARANMDNVLDLRVDGENVLVLPTEGEVRFRGEHYSVQTESALDRAAAGSRASNGAASRRIVAAMPGRIIQISCQVGQAVTVGAPLVVMEAMKMQNELAAKGAGIVRAIAVVVGQTVERGELLVELE